MYTLSNYKKRIFIASSSEGKKYAEKVKEILSSICNVTIWTDNFFKLSVSTFGNLCKNAINYDFAIIIYTKDDISVVKKHTYFTARDNITFEHGLFTGIIGRHKTFALIQNGVKIPSDLSGITYCQFNDLNDLQKNCYIILNSITDEMKVSRVSLLPSTSIALTYFNNFIKPVCESIYDKSNIIYNNSKIQFNINHNRFLIMIPPKISDDMKPQVLYYANQLNLENIHISGFHRNFHIFADFKNNKFNNIVDIPAVLSISYQVIKLYTGKDYIGKSKEFNEILHKEIDCFVSTLKLLIENNSIVESITEISLLD